MKTRIFSFTAIAAMCAMPIITEAEDKTVGDRVDKAIEKVTDAVTPDQPMNDAASAPVLPAGITKKENNDIADVRGALATIVNRTLTRSGMDGAIAYLANQDRDRIKAQLKDTGYENKLDGQVDQIRGLFKQKYGEDFQLTAAALNTSTAVQQGEIQDAATARKHWPLPYSTSQAVPNTLKMGDVQVRDMKGTLAPDKPDMPLNDDPKFENGRDVAVVRFAPMPGKKEAVILSMQYELPNYWVLDVPNSHDGPEVMKCQEEVLQKIIDMKDQWPASKDEAYRAIAGKILGAYARTGDEKPHASTPRE